MYNAFLLFLPALGMGVASAQDVKAAEHITTGVKHATGALDNGKNYLDADPSARIDIASAAGIDFMLQVPKTANSDNAPPLTRRSS